MKNKINNLNKKLELQEEYKTPDEIGGFICEWKKVKNIWGSISLVSNNISTTYNILEIKATHIITVRRLNNINNNMRFIYNSFIYNIKYINDLDNYYTEVICERII